MGMKCFCIFPANLWKNQSEPQGTAPGGADRAAPKQAPEQPPSPQLLRTSSRSCGPVSGPNRSSAARPPSPCGAEPPAPAARAPTPTTAGTEQPPALRAERAQISLPQIHSRAGLPALGTASAETPRLIRHSTHVALLRIHTSSI